MLTVITFATDTAIILGNMNYKHTQNGNVAKYLLCPDSSNNWTLSLFSLNFHVSWAVY